MPVRPVLAVTSITLLCVLLVAPVSAYRYYLKRLPNFDKVPCPDNDETCFGSGLCEAFGHEACSAHADENDFGDSMEDHGGFWTTGYCQEDSDGDGFTNGDELGDPCCEWNMGDVPPRVTDISHPSHPGSTPVAHTSCTNAGPMTPTVATDVVSDTWAAVALTSAGPTCLCALEVEVDTGSGAPATRSVAPAATLVLCDLPANTAVTVAVTSSNVAGAGAQETLTFTTAAAGSGATRTAACTPTRTPRAAGTVRTTYTKPTVMAAMAAGPMLLVAVLGGAACCLSMRRPSSPLWRCQRVITRGPLYSRLPSAAAAAALVLLLAATAAACWAAWQWFHVEGFVYNNRLPVARALGYGGATAMGLALIPTTKRSIVGALMGASFERALYVHRFMGRVAVALVVAHGVWMAVAYVDTPMGADHMLRWSTADSLNTLPGTLAGILLVVLFVLALGWVRRAKYSLFFVSHLLFIPVLVLTLVHLRGSDAAVLALLIPGILFLVVDVMLYIADFCVRPTSVVSTTSLPSAGAHHAALVLDKQLLRPLAAIADKLPLWLSSRLHFTYHPGQYVFLCVPRVSLLPHPFTISSAPDPSHPGRFTLHLLADGKFSQALVHRAAAAAGGTGHSPLRMYVAGPFGVPSVRFDAYNHLLLAAGGVGVTPIASELAGLQAAVAAGRRKPPHSVTVVWAARSPALMQDLRHLFAPAQGADGAASPAAMEAGQAGAHSGPAPPATKPAVPALAAVVDSGASRTFPTTVHLHLTRASADDVAATTAATGLPVSSSRPDWQAVVAATAATAKAQSPGAPAVGVMVCGPTALIQAVEQACLAGAPADPEVRFHVHSETFIM